MSISARSERVARGSPSTTFSPRAFLTVTAYFGGRTGAGASLDLSGSGVSGGASSGLTTEVSADIIFQKARCHQFKQRTVFALAAAFRHEERPESFRGCLWPPAKGVCYRSRRLTSGTDSRGLAIR